MLATGSQACVKSVMLSSVKSLSLTE